MYATQELQLNAEPKRFTWLKQSLARQFIVVASGVLLLGMFALETWVSRRIESGVAEVAAASAVLYINNFVTPHLQELASNDRLSEQSVKVLDQAMQTSAVRSHVLAIKVWRPDGTIVYSTDQDLIGKRPSPSPGFRAALGGEVSATLEAFKSEENAKERASGLSLIEIYAPIRETTTGEIIAIMEFYENAAALHAQLAAVEWESWIMAGLVTLAMIGALFVIVADGSRTIDQQRISLAERVLQLSDLLSQNELLRSRVERAAKSATEENERFIRRLGSDLHDGPAQLIGLALLRLDALEGANRENDNFTIVRSALSDALSDIRNFCSGLLLPEVQRFTLQEALLFMVQDHERRTRTTVRCNILDLPIDPPLFVKICLCRFVQEGLNNAFRHAGGVGQRLSAWWDGETVRVEVADDGPGIAASGTFKDSTRLGLTGLRDRIESIGGTMKLDSHPGSGTRLTACLSFTTGDHHV